MILHVLDALAELSAQKVVVVVGHRGEWVTKTLVDHAPASLSISFVEQPEQLGTGDAVAVGITGLPESLADADGDVVVLPGDTPLVRAPTLAALVRHHRDTGAAATLLTALLPDPTGHDRVVRGKDDAVISVMEGAEVRFGDDVDEVATTIHCFRHTVMAPALRRLRPLGITGEHSLTGIYAVLHDAGYRVESLVTDDPMEAARVNDRAQLAVAEAELRDRINERWMRRGVTMWDPERTYVDASVHLEPDVVLLPGVVLQGDCRVGAGAEIGPDSHLVDTVVGEGATVTKTTAVRADIGEHARVGPFVSLDPGAEVAPGSLVEPFSRVNGPGIDLYDATS
jgi:bifunctional UDP-N-acetylglucosamine pyrophosphorylase/glucosamine-1-phosphate N-acetyltransferase